MTTGMRRIRSRRYKIQFC